VGLLLFKGSLSLRNLEAVIIAKVKLAPGKILKNFLGSTATTARRSTVLMVKWVIGILFDRKHHQELLFLRNLTLLHPLAIGTHFHLPFN
jgi:hypothetical protein